MPSGAFAKSVEARLRDALCYGAFELLDVHPRRFRPQELIHSIRQLFEPNPCAQNYKLRTAQEVIGHGSPSTASVKTVIDQQVAIASTHVHMLRGQKGRVTQAV